MARSVREAPPAMFEASGARAAFSALAFDRLDIARLREPNRRHQRGCACGVIHARLASSVERLR
jgi:hypothetical protein